MDTLALADQQRHIHQLSMDNGRRREDLRRAIDDRDDGKRERERERKLRKAVLSVQIDDDDDIYRQ